LSIYQETFFTKTLIQVDNFIVPNFTNNEQLHQLFDTLKITKTFQKKDKRMFEKEHTLFLLFQNLLRKS